MSIPRASAATPDRPSLMATDHPALVGSASSGRGHAQRPHIGIGAGQGSLEAGAATWPAQAVARPMAAVPWSGQAESEQWLARSTCSIGWAAAQASPALCRVLPAALIGAANLRAFPRGCRAGSGPGAYSRGQPCRPDWRPALACRPPEKAARHVVLPYRDRLEVFSAYLQQL